ncbi:MAG TPA: flavin reductase family protein [Bacillota bacterium]|nr:flavin reductase family protein [Bacillota bacterium]
MTIAKTILKAQTSLFPLPVVVVSCASDEHRPNLITLAWAGTLCSIPPVIGISINPLRHSHAIVNRSKEFVVNIPSVTQQDIATFCGVESGRKLDKFAHFGLTAGKAETLKYAPILSEFAVNIECVVVKQVELGSHTLFLGEIKATQVSDSVMDKDGTISTRLTDPIAYAGSRYYALGQEYTLRRN